MIEIMIERKKIVLQYYSEYEELYNVNCKLFGRSSVRYLHPDFGHFDSNIRRWIDIGGPATTSRFSRHLDVITTAAQNLRM